MSTVTTSAQTFDGVSPEAMIPHVNVIAKRWITFSAITTMIVVSLSSAILSFDGLRRLALNNSVPERLAFLFPIAIDATILMGSLAVLLYEMYGIRARFGWFTVIFGTALSVIGNVISVAQAGVIGQVLHGIIPILLCISLESLLRILRFNIRSDVQNAAKAYIHPLAKEKDRTTDNPVESDSSIEKEKEDKEGHFVFQGTYSPTDKDNIPFRMPEKEALARAEAIEKALTPEGVEEEKENDGESEVVSNGNTTPTATVTTTTADEPSTNEIGNVEAEAEGDTTKDSQPEPVDPPMVEVQSAPSSQATVRPTAQQPTTQQATPTAPVVDSAPSQTSSKTPESAPVSPSTAPVRTSAPATPPTTPKPTQAASNARRELPPQALEKLKQQMERLPAKMPVYQKAARLSVLIKRPLSKDEIRFIFGYDANRNVDATVVKMNDYLRNGGK